MSDKFNSYNDMVDLSPLADLCLREGKPVCYERGEYLLHHGDRGRYIALVLSGYCRYVMTRDDGTEAVVGLALKGDLATGFSDAMRGRPSRISIIASTRVDVLQLPLVYAMDTVAETNPGIRGQMFEALAGTLYERMLDLYGLSATQRYRKFASAYPDIVAQIQTQELASYLQITPQHLRRIKKS